MNKINLKNTLRECNVGICRYSSWLLWLFTFISAYAVIQIKLGWGIYLGYSDQADDINDVILNLSYSYLAALLFYILTVKLPYWDMKYKVHKALQKKVKLIESNYKACAESVLPITKTLPADINKEMLVSLFQDRSYLESCRLDVFGNNTSIIVYIRKKHEENREIAKEILEYKSWLNSDLISEIEILRNSNLVSVINGLQVPKFQVDMAKDKGCRKILAETVFDLWEISKRLKLDL